MRRNWKIRSGKCLAMTIIFFLNHHVFCKTSVLKETSNNKLHNFPNPINEGVANGSFFNLQMFHCFELWVAMNSCHTSKFLLLSATQI